MKSTRQAVEAANDVPMRGFTGIRDLGGPVFGLERGIDSGLAHPVACVGRTGLP